MAEPTPLLQFVKARRGTNRKRFTDSDSAKEPMQQPHVGANAAALPPPGYQLNILAALAQMELDKVDLGPAIQPSPELQAQYWKDVCASKPAV